MNNLDITFCSKTNCKNKECKRNQNHLWGIVELVRLYHPISIADFKKCDFWEEENE